MNCAASTVKYLLFFFNFLIFLCGIALLVPGIVSLIKFGDATYFLDGKFNVPAITVTTVGGLLLIIGFFGCCGAIKENSCMMKTYTALVIIIVLVEVAIGIVAFVYRDDIDGILTDEIKNEIGNYTQPGADRSRINSLQMTFECCGNDGPQDYIKLGNLYLPPSCCGKEESTSTATSCPITSPDVFPVGCSAKLKEFITSVSDLIGGMAIGIGVVEVVVIILSCCLSGSMKD